MALSAKGNCAINIREVHPGGNGMTAFQSIGVFTGFLIVADVYQMRLSLWATAKIIRILAF